MPDSPRFAPELLAPAGDMEKLETAILYGADAVYLGGGALNLRAGAGGFTRDELFQAVERAHAAGVKIYFTLNVYPREDMIPQVREYMDLLAELRPDGVIAADPGVIAMLRSHLPDMSVHVSTQANTSNSETVRFWASIGARRVNVARELRSQELMQMLAICRREITDMEIEVFVHGAMCMAVSGRCYLSAMLNDRPGNLGQCSHPCRYEYRPKAILLEERTRPGEDLWVIQEYGKDTEPASEFTFDEPSDEFTFETPQETPADPALSIAQDHGGWTKFFAAEDLCLLHYLEWFSRMRVASIKIEGRTKSSSYLAQVVDAYRTALNDIRSNEFRAEKYLPELVNAASRPLTTGFFDPDRRGAIALPPDESEKRPVLARILENAGPGRWLVQTKARWNAARDIEAILPGLNRPRITPEGYALENDEGEGLTVSHPGQKAVLVCDLPGLAPGMFLRAAWDLDDLE